MPSPFPRRVARCIAAAFLTMVVVASPAGAQGPQPPPAVEAHPALARAPRHTRTRLGHQGDPVNVAFVGTEQELHRVLAAAGWYAADPVTLGTSLRIAADVVLRKPYDHAPVSDLFLWDRVQDAAFEQPVGDSPQRRHHVRFWRSVDVDTTGRPLWLGAATFDERVEISRTTGGVTHRIGADVDAERNKVVTDTHRTGVLGAWYWVEGFHAEREGRNGGGDPWFTDGRLAVGVIGTRR